MPLTHATVERIGHIVGLCNTEYNGVTSLNPETASDGEYCFSGSARIFNKPGYPPLLVFTGLVPGHAYVAGGSGHNTTNSVYVLNLNTLRPTRNSFKQVELPHELKSIIRTEFCG
jgi:hypothetical protein